MNSHRAFVLLLIETQTRARTKIEWKTWIPFKLIDGVVLWSYKNETGMYNNKFRETIIETREHLKRNSPLKISKKVSVTAVFFDHW